MKPSSRDVFHDIVRTYNERVMTNIRRADYVEAIVAVALRDAGWFRKTPWDSWDFQHRDSGHRVEVKHAAARQTWGERTAGQARFDIAPRTGYWDESDTWHDVPGRHAHVYIFAWHPDSEASADQREPMSWLFYVISEHALPRQKSIGLNQVKRLVDPSLADRLHSVLARLLNLP